MPHREPYCAHTFGYRNIVLTFNFDVTPLNKRATLWQSLNGPYAYA